MYSHTAEVSIVADNFERISCTLVLYDTLQGVIKVDSRANGHSTQIVPEEPIGLLCHKPTKYFIMNFLLLA